MRGKLLLQTYIVGESCEGLAVHFQNYVTGLHLASGPGRLVRKQSFDANQAWEGGIRVDATRYGQAQATGAFRDLYDEGAVYGCVVQKERR